MAFRDILVYLDPTPASEDRLRVAIGLAKAHAARLIGVDASSDEAFLGAWGKHALRIEPTFGAVTSSVTLVPLSVVGIPAASDAAISAVPAVASDEAVS